MDYDYRAKLWPTPVEKYFRAIKLTHRVQDGSSCVSTGLSLLTHDDPCLVREQINTQDPVSWSMYLQSFQMKLAYCPTDFRKLIHFGRELLMLDDLFTISTYSPASSEEIGGAPDEVGWICGSHFVVLHRNMIYDTRLEAPVDLREYQDLGRYVKRIFRIVPSGHARGL